ncbi:sensor histidine kinase [Modestobacter versicolor]|uniref:Two-component system sensor histidine kinase DesK n=1 Tax=Modestobacter versicolor TaxID=429133 RepID=A0A839Y5N6_9ACTN|nr:sensor histidine kinase [Modestobacter versicolor]MBB3677727.1 two-component system sensor histidine kinase DesK [Modestobacter versicolor]
MPTVSRWWSSRSAPQRIDLYTRWSFYSYLGAGLPLLALAVTGSDLEDARVAGVRSFLVGSVVTAVAAVVLASRGLAAHRTGQRIPVRTPGLALGAAAVTGALGVWGFSAGAEPAPATSWAIALPLGMVLTAGSTIWSTRQLAGPSVLVGVLAGAAAAVDGSEAVTAVVVGATIAVTVYAVVLAFRFSVWVLDVVLEMDRTRGVQLQLAVAEERLRFARDLHDVMGRNLSAIAVKSQLAGELVRRARPEAADEVADIHRIAEESLREVREVVRGYRSTDLSSELAGARSVLRAAGVACTVQGVDDAGALPEPVQAALGWVVREAVTNVLRHSRAAECGIVLTRADGEVRLTVTNDGVPGDAAGTGSGLAGLRERLAGAGGTLDAARHGDRFQLTATLPTGSAG